MIMKNNQSKYFLAAALLISLFGCQKNDIYVAPAKLGAVSNLKYSLVGDSVLLTWTLPQSDSLTIIINDGSSTIQLPLNATSYKYGIVQTNKNYIYSVKVKDTKGNTSLGETASFIRQGAYPVKNLAAVQNDAGVLVSWTAPDSAVSKITIKIGSQSIDLTPTATSYQFNNVAPGQYTISVVTTNSANQTSNTVYLPFKVGATMVGYVGVYADSTTLLTTGDDDEVAAAQWLFSTYSGKSRYISLNQVKNGTVDLSQYRVIWWNYDITTGKDLPAIATDATVVSKMTQYYKNGGGLLLNQYAVQYFWTLGRVSKNYFMGFDTGTGFDNPDTWGIGVNIFKKHNYSSHPLFTGIAMTTQPDGRVTFPVIGPGWKENHNAVIVRIPEFYGGLPNDDGRAFTYFSTDNNAEWLGQWDGIGDYYMAGIVEFKPQNDFLGSGIYIGIGGIEWHQNSGTNLYQANIQKLYKNAIDYLKTK
jgi:hypothetical protein